MPPVNGVGEPCAGEPHARFDAAGAGNGAPGHGHRSEAARRGNPGKSGCGTSRRTTPPRQPPTLPPITGLFLTRRSHLGGATSDSADAMGTIPAMPDELSVDVFTELGR